MRVTVRLFARLREIVGAGELPIEVQAPADIRAIWTQLAETHPGLAPYASSISAARNMDYARMDTNVSDGDEIAFLPPVSGGAPDTVGRHNRSMKNAGPRLPTSNSQLPSGSTAAHLSARRLGVRNRELTRPFQQTDRPRPKHAG